MSDLQVLGCIRCGSPINIAQYFSKPVERITPVLGATVHLRLRSGVRLLVQDPFSCAYCPVCAPGVRFCVACGCTDEAACPKGCSWTQAETPESGDVCTSCE